MAYAPDFGGGRQGGAADYPLATDWHFADIPTGASGHVVVGVIDTGVAVNDDQPHPYIANNLAEGWREHRDLLPTDRSALGRYDGHGTFVAGLIVRQAPSVTIDMRRVLDEPGLSGRQIDAAVVQAIGELGDVENIKVINLSFFGDAELKEPAAIRTALHDLFAQHGDVLVVTVAGNLGIDRQVWPGAFSGEFDNVVTVGALDDSLIPDPAVDALPPRASFSNWGEHVDAYAPGARVLGPGPTYLEPVGPDDRPPQNFRGWQLWSGTSFAAATVSGQVAQLLIDRPELTPLEAWRQLKASRPVGFIRGIPEEYWRPYLPGIVDRGVADPIDLPPQ